VVFLIVAFVVVPVAELYVIVQTSHAVGFLTTLALLLICSMVGGWLVKREGLNVWRRAQAQLQRGQMPGNELVDGVLVLAAGALLLTPGFLTDAVGVLLLLPPTRAILRRLTVGRFRQRVTVVRATHSGPIDVNEWTPPAGEVGP
jgi:UPF0716 protein FxsA